MLASCGPALAVHIPTARTHPRLTQGRGAASPPAPGPVARVTSIAVAPGVAVPPVALAAPRVTVSSRYPPPPGTSVATVVADFLRDNAIDNVALERGDASLLAYADGGRLLEALHAQLRSTHFRRPYKVTDRFSSIQVGGKKDPNSGRVSIALIVVGVEADSHFAASGKLITASFKLDEIVWCRWAPSMSRYLLVDDATS